MKRYVLGDVHGGFRALLQVLKRSGFDYNQDLLISLGDIADGWSEVPECFEELLKIKNLVYVMGNHDKWLYDWFKFGASPYIWLSQGGQASIDAYIRHYTKDGTKIAKRHEEILKNSVYYYEIDKKLFVHGGYDWHNPIKESLPGDCMWDRHLYEIACYCEINKSIVVKDYDEVYIGHTTTTYPMNHKIGPSYVPLKVSNVWNLDQGAGWEGKLSIMDIDSKEFWQSDLVKTLYPEEKGRG